MKPIAFVIPWYGDKIAGGAESACRSIAKHLQKSGINVEVLTTTVKEFKADWNTNHHKPGISEESNIPVRRFAVNSTDQKSFSQVNRKLMLQEEVSLKEELIFFGNMISSPDLITYIQNHQSDYHAFVFMPYMFQTTIEGIEAANDKAVIIPCLHDEAYAKTKTVKKMMEQVRGIIYLAEPEKTFSNNQYQIDSSVRQEVLGTFLSETSDKKKQASNPDSFKAKYNILDPYILYAGRKDAGKNADLLAQYFIEYKKRSPNTDLKLVCIGDRSPFDFSHPDILDLGFVEREEKYDAMAGSLFLCQPSVMESFSIVIMEAWLEGRPVLVHENCAVTQNFAQQSNGGLWFSDYNTFSKCIEFFLINQAISSVIGNQGKEYVIDNFSDKVLIEKYLEFFN